MARDPPVEHPLEPLEQRAAAGRGVVGGQPVEGAAEQRQGPGAVEEPLGGQVVGRLDEVAALGVAGVDRHRRPVAAPLLGPVAVAAAGQEEAAVGAEEGAEAARAAVGGGEDGLLQQPGEVLLGQVEGVGLAVTQAPDQRIDRVPVRRAQLAERRGRRPRRVARAGDAAPAGRREAAGGVGSFIMGAVTPGMEVFDG